VIDVTSESCGKREAKDPNHIWHLAACWVCHSPGSVVSDVAMLPDLLHGEERRVWGDGAYPGQTKVIRKCAPRALDFTQRRCRYQGQILDEVAWAKNRAKSKVRAKVEHVFQVMKMKFGFVKVRYRGRKKNAHRLFVTCTLVNLFLSRKKLLRAAAA
jgi:transposase, IS5 family